MTMRYRCRAPRANLVLQVDLPQPNESTAVADFELAIQLCVGHLIGRLLLCPACFAPRLVVGRRDRIQGTNYDLVLLRRSAARLRSVSPSPDTTGPKPSQATGPPAATGA
jgi:hypothetical protein